MPAQAPAAVGDTEANRVVRTEASAIKAQFGSVQWCFSAKSVPCLQSATYRLQGVVVGRQSPGRGSSHPNSQPEGPRGGRAVLERSRPRGVGQPRALPGGSLALRLSDQPCARKHPVLDRSGRSGDATQLAVLRSPRGYGEKNRPVLALDAATREAGDEIPLREQKAACRSIPDSCTSSTRRRASA